MSIRSIVLAAAIVATIALGYYFGRSAPAPVVDPSATAQNATSGPQAPPAKRSPPPQQAQPTPLEDLVKSANELGVNGRIQPGVAVVGGEEIPLRFQISRRPQPVTDIDDGKSGGFFEPLAAAARAGNDDAAHQLYEALRVCVPTPKNRAEFDARVEKARKMFEQGGGFLGPGETVTWEQVMEGHERAYKRCEGVTPDMYKTAAELLRESAERGNDDNRLSYAAAINDSDPKEARAQEEILWHKGSLPALGVLGWTSLPRRIAYLAASGAYINSGARDELAKLEASTSPSEFQEAAKEAARILKGNPNCCKL